MKSPEKSPDRPFTIASPEIPSASQLLLDVHERPDPPQWIILAIQHVFAMFGATILVPILVNAGAGATVLTIPVALVTSGIGTLIYIICTKGRSPVYIGSSFAFIGPVVAAYATAGIAGAMTGIMAVGIIYVIAATAVRFAGKGWIDWLLPPVVVGPMIMIIGLGLAPNAVSQIGISSDAATRDWRSIAVALITLLVTILIAVAGRGFLKIIPVLTGIVTGYIAAVLFGLVDFTPVLEAQFLQVPAFVLPFVSYAPNFNAIFTVAPIALVTMAEHIGDHFALGKIIGKDLLHDPGLDRTLAGDGIATFFAAMLGGPANTTYGENTSVVGMTKVASVWVIGLAAIFAVCLGFLGKFTALVSTIPDPVLGGVSLVLYGFIATNGLKVLVENRVDFSKLRNVMIVSVMMCLGLGQASIPLNIGNISIAFSGMSLAAIAGVLLNLFLPQETTVSN